MFNWFLAALGMDYLQNKPKPTCQHVELYRDGTTVRCRTCSHNWPWLEPPEFFPQDWELQIRRKIAQDNQK